ncbi:site-specific DNA-methyltransferase [Nibribacter koreensis]|uniref:Methyltransferase n=1 Tax=Nibribacter koreensis TaxID=1084519 RepID=A0ABP8FB65_9BACT
MIPQTLLNKIHHQDNREGMAQLPDKCANLIIADPPYFEVKGDFDFVFPSFDAYLEFMEEQARHYKRILADNGTLFVYGDAKNIAYVQTIFDHYFNLANSLVWENTNPHKQQTKWATGLRSFAPLTERILMYTQDVFNLTECVFYIRDYIRAEIMKAKGRVVFKEVNAALGTATNGGGVASACLSLDKAEPGMITKEMYLKLQEWCSPYLRKEYEDLRKEYEDLRKEYEDKRRPFYNFQNWGDVIRLPNFETGDYEHETIKPEKLTRTLILTCSRPNDLVVVPFAGSGTECAMSLKEGRRFIGYETDAKHVQTATDRCHQIMRTPTLFDTIHQPLNQAS